MIVKIKFIIPDFPEKRIGIPVVSIEDSIFGN
jgi:hypothetical protein